MLGLYVCRQCRTRIVPRAALLRNPQCRPESTFISLRNGTATPKEAQEPTANETTPTSSSEGAHASSKIRRVRLEPNWPARDRSREDSSAARSQGQTQRGRYSRYAQNAELHEPGHTGESAEGQSIGHGTEQSERYTDSAAHNARTSPESSLQGGPNIRAPEIAPPYAALLQNELRNGNLNRAWSIFLENYTSKDSEALTKPSFRDIGLLNSGRIFSELLQTVTDHFVRANQVPVAPSKVLFIYQQQDLARPEFWIKTITMLTHQLLYAISDTYENLQSSDALLSELTSVWRLFFQCHGSTEDPLKSIAVDWTSLPDADQLNKLTTTPSQSRDFVLRLQQYHPKYAGNAALGFCAVTYFNLFDKVNQDVLQASDLAREQSAPFLQALTYFLAGSRVDRVLKHTEVSSGFKVLSKEFQDAIIEQIKSAPSEAMLAIGSGGSVQESISPEDRASNIQEFFRKRINSAILQKEHSGMLEKLWHDIDKAYSPNNSQGNKPVIPEALYNLLLTGFMALRLPERSVEVWNHMIAHGIKPSVRSWTAMLKGCQKGHDLDGLNAIWAKLMKSGIEPDDYAWTTRVHALISFRQINAGFAAMDEMGKRWITAEMAMKNPPKKGNKNIPKITVNNYTKPSMGVVNGAISAFVNMMRNNLSFAQKKESVQKVLQWAGNFSLKPDAWTYNTLIMMYIQGGDYPTSFKLLQQMEKEKIEPDLATYTMLIRSAFDNQKFANLSEAEQSARMISTFTELEAGGLKLNSQIYSSIIDRLLKQYENFSAVRAIIAHMTERNISPSPHIYTALVTAYFQQSPPKIAAVDSLWMQIMNTRGSETDKVLFDRLLEGYAANNEVGRMMAVLTRMSVHGKAPSWNALAAVVTALGQAGDYQRIKDIVNDVLNSQGVGQGGVTGAVQHRKFFFHVVVDKLGIDPREFGGQAGRELAGATRGPDVKQMAEVENEGLKEQQEAQRLWNEQLNEGTDELVEEVRGEVPIREKADGGEGKSEDWREEDNGTMGGIPL